MAKSHFQQAGFQKGDTFIIEAKQEFVNLTEPKLDRLEEKYYQLNVAVKGKPDEYRVLAPKHLSEEDKQRIATAGNAYLGLATYTSSKKDADPTERHLNINIKVNPKDKNVPVNPENPKANLNIEKAQPDQYIKSEDGQSVRRYNGGTAKNGTPIQLVFEVVAYDHPKFGKGLSGYLRGIIYPNDMELYGDGRKSTASIVEGFYLVEDKEEEPKASDFATGDPIAFGDFEETKVEDKPTETITFGFGDASTSNPFASTTNPFAK